MEEVFENVRAVHIWLEKGGLEVHLEDNDVKTIAEFEGIRRVDAYATPIDGVSVSWYSVHFWFDLPKTLRLKEGCLEVVKTK